MSTTSRCWCGSSDFAVFSPDYVRCLQCETLVLAHMPQPQTFSVQNDATDFYGRTYYESHLIKDYGYPDLMTRVRSDLPERGLHWLRTVLKYKLPIGRALELGSAHGGFVALLQWAGFEATGLELSAWVINFARQTFHVPMLQGPIEDQTIEPGTLDVIALMDVLEHLPDPVGTMRHCLELLKPDGIMVIQTPCFPEDQTFEDIIAINHAFLKQLKNNEHLYLFSQSSIKKLFHDLQAEYLNFEPAIFSHYDMFLVVSRQPMAINSTQAIEEALGQSPGGRLIQALIDKDSEFQSLTRRYTMSEADRATRHKNIQTLEALLSHAEADRTARLQLIEQNGQHLAKIVAERDDLLKQIITQQSYLQEQTELIAEQQSHLQEQTELIAEQQQKINTLQTSIQQLQVEVTHSRSQWGVLQQKILSFRASQIYRKTRALGIWKQPQITEQDNQSLTNIMSDHDDLITQVTAQQSHLQEQAELITEQQKKINMLQASMQQLQTEVMRSRAQWKVLQQKILSFRASQIYRKTRALGIWRWFDDTVMQALPAISIANDQNPPMASPAKRRLHRIAIDLTPILPGGENGGAKLMTIELVKHLSQIAPKYEFILLTAERNHNELAMLDAPNVRRLCILQSNPDTAEATSFTARIRQQLYLEMTSRLQPTTYVQLRNIYQWFSHKTQNSSRPLKALDIDLVFCPFTAPFYFDPTVPMVAVVYDLQHFYYPQFFSGLERSSRSKNFHEICRTVSQLVCISEFVRSTVLEHTTLDPIRVRTVHIQLPHRLTEPTANTIINVLTRVGVEQNQFLLYPANFWQHKNHDMLLVALGGFYRRNPGSQLKLVCTGTPSPRMVELQQAVQRMSLEDKVFFPGYVSDTELAALLQACTAVIYPSLYEGFGMPLIEAMAYGKPVLCSNVTSLPEVAGEAALMFDPRKPDEIIQAIEQLVANPALATELVQKGYQRLTTFDDPAAMARQYLEIFRDAAADVDYFADALQGVYPDGWIGASAVVTFGASTQQRRLEIKLTAQTWTPQPYLLVRVVQNGNDTLQKHTIDKGTTITILLTLSQSSGYIEILADPVFQPKAMGLNSDKRSLTCKCESCRIISPTKVIELL